MQRREGTVVKRCLVVLVLVLASCTSAGEAEISSTSSNVAPSTSTTTTTTPDENVFCPFSPFTDIGKSVDVKRAWVDECANRAERWAIEVRSSQWLTLANTGSDLWIVDLGDYHVEIPPGEVIDTPPAANFLDATLVYELESTTTVEMRDVTFGPLQGTEILLQRIGPVGPGLTLGEVVAAARHPVDLDDAYEFFLPECAIGSFRGADGLYMLFAGDGKELRLQYIEVTRPGLATRSGIEVGDTADAVVETYGDQVEYRSEFGSFEGQNLVFQPQTDDQFGLVFLLDQDNLVRGIRIGLADAVALMEGCA